MSGHTNKVNANYPSLRRFLQDANGAASQAIVGDVGSSCADPKSWLNSAGHGNLLSELPGIDHYNASMLWGTYRPGVYFGKLAWFSVVLQYVDCINA